MWLKRPQLGTGGGPGQEGMGSRTQGKRLASGSFRQQDRDATFSVNGGDKPFVNVAAES